jgi:hypothetical protein
MPRNAGRNLALTRHLGLSSPKYLIQYRGERTAADLLGDLDEENAVDDVEHVEDGAHGGRLDLDGGQAALRLPLN